MPHSTSDPTRESISPGEAVGKAAFYLQKDIYTVPDWVKAQLRRLDPSSPLCPAVHRLLVRFGQDEAEDWISQDRWERRWAIVFHAAALCGSLHDYDSPLGRALAHVGVSESRLTSLLEAKGPHRLFPLVSQVSRRLRRGEAPFNIAEIQLLVFYQTGETGEDIRLDISRSFYRAFQQDSA